METLRKTPLHSWHVQHNARLVPFAGWEMPLQFRGLVEEHKAVRQGCGLFDVSHMGQLHISGEHACEVIDHAVTNDVGKLPVGKALYTVACKADAGILDDLIVYRRGEWEFSIVCNASNRAKMVGVFQSACDGRCEFEDLSDARALIAIQGPHAVDVVRKLNDGEQATALRRFGCGEFRLEGVKVFIARTGYTGEDGFEISTRAEDAQSLWCALLEKGSDWGCAPAGLGARDTLRLESALSLYGNEIDETTHPIEARLGWVVKMDKPSFEGKPALEAILSKPLRRQLVGIEMVGRGIARHGYSVVDADTGASIGTVTSGSPSPTLGKNIGLAYLPISLSNVGSKIWIRVREQLVEAKVVPTPFYRREHSGAR